MTRRLRGWIETKWRRATADQELLNAYHLTFSTLHGRIVLRHLMDDVYCQTCPSLDPLALATHNGCRSVVQDILEKIDQAESPKKYDTYTEELHHAT